MKKMRFIISLLASSSGLIVHATADAAPAEEASDDTAPEIVVTANKRTQALSDVGLTAAVLSGESLAEKKITTLADIAANIPGLSFSATENNTPVFTLRGIGFNEAALAAYPTVSVYIDEAPLAFPALSSQGAFDLERIEVLKGPQGTLFGQNSTGGAINYIAAKPTDRFAAGGDISYSRFNTIEMNGFVSGPLSDTLKARVAGHYIHGDPWQYSYTRDDRIGKVSAIAGRMSFDWTPSAAARFQLTLTGWRDTSDPQAGRQIAIYPQVPGVDISQVTSYPYPPDDARAADWSYGAHVGPTGMVLDPRPTSFRRFLQGTLRGDVDVTDTITATSLTSYLDFRQTQSLDYDGQATNEDDFPFNDGTIKSFFQELRFSNGEGGPARWVVGANYQNSEIFESNSSTYADASSSIPALNNIIANGYRSTTDRRDYAFFANIEYDVLPNVTLKGGARYTNNSTAIRACNYDLGDGRVNELFTGLARSFPGNANLPALQPGDCFFLDSNGVPGAYQNTLHEDNVSWRVGVDFKPSRNILVYANLSRGYKAGSYPTISASAHRQFFPVRQESVMAYEAGFKLSSADRRLSLNGAAFYYSYDEKQIRGKLVDPIFGVLNALVNVPKSRLYGFELEASARPLKGLSINASVTYVNTRIAEYSGPSVIGGNFDFAGAKIPFAPAWSAQIDGEYRWEMGSVKPFVGATLNKKTSTSTYIGGEYLTIPNVAGASTAPGVTHPFQLPGYTTLDLRAGVEFADRWKFMVWGKNVTNTFYLQNVINGYDTAFSFVGRPATYGATLSWAY